MSDSNGTNPINIFTPVNGTMKLHTVVIMVVSKEARLFITVCHFHLSLKLVRKAGACQSFAMQNKVFYGRNHCGIEVS